MVDKTLQDQISIGKIFKDRVGYDFMSHLLTYQVTGGRSYGTSLDSKNSDRDYNGLFAPPLRNIIGVKHVHDKTWAYLDPDKGIDVALYPLQHWFRLLAKENPTITCMLWNNPKFILFRNELFDDLCDIRADLLSKNAYHAYRGYAKHQLHLLKKSETEEPYIYDFKCAMHAVRVIRMGIEHLELGRIIPDRTLYDAPELLDIRRGKWAFKNVLDLLESLVNDLDRALAASALPPEPPYEVLDDFCADAFWQMWRQTGEPYDAV